LKLVEAIRNYLPVDPEIIPEDPITCIDGFVAPTNVASLAQAVGVMEAGSTPMLPPRRPPKSASVELRREEMGTRLIQLSSGPQCCSVSAGGIDGLGYYCVFRGKREEVTECLRQVLKALEHPAHLVIVESNS
jgi:hypothetical protein